MRRYKYIFCAFMIACAISCGRKQSVDVETEQAQSSSIAATISVSSANDIDLINTVYDQFVFAIESGADNNPETYFTNNALKKLQDDYEYDCEDGPCYAYYALRTANQDSNPDSDDVSLVHSVEPTADGWYVVTYSDMGWNGKTRIKIVNGKIDDYERLEP